jgi:hypothetical protein
MRKKNRNRLIWGIVIVLAIIFYRGLKAETKGSFDCEYKIVYAVCVAKKTGAETPGLWNILKSGVKF